MHEDSTHRGRDNTKGNTHGRSCSVSVLCNGVLLICILRVLVEEVMML